MLSESGLAEIANDPPLSAKEKKRSQNRVAQRVYRKLGVTSSHSPVTQGVQY